MLHSLSPALATIFSLHQGNPFAGILFTIHIEPFLVRLEALLRGLFVGAVREASLGYMDDIAAMGDTDADLITTDEVCRDFEAVSGAILNRNRKSVILGLGSWAGRQDWPLPWLLAVPQAKVYGVTFAATYRDTVAASWDRVIGGVERTLALWMARRLPTLCQRAQALEVYALSRAWYLAQILPLPAAQAGRLRRAAGDFLWRGRLERLAYDELHRPLREGGLGLSCIASRADALLVKQAAHQIAAGGRPARHFAY
jgi:hypothetical protein